MKEEVKIKIESNEECLYGLDEPSKKDWTWDEYELFTDKEYGNGTTFKSRPENVKIWNQGNTPACGCYSATHIYNGENILEDKRLNQNREQQDPTILRNRFCADRNNYSTGTSVQTMADWFKKQGLSQGYVTIPRGTKQVEQMKKSIDMGSFISTGSSNCDRIKTKQIGTYTLRKDGKFVGHLWCIVDYNDTDRFFRAVNSYGDKRGHYGGMFKVPYDLIPTIYSTLAIIDKDDSGAFTNLKSYKKAMELLSIAKELYNNGNDKQKKYFEQIQLTKTIKDLYNIN